MVERDESASPLWGRLFGLTFLAAGFLAVRQFIFFGVFSPRSTLDMVVGTVGVAAGLWAIGIGVARKSTAHFLLAVAAVACAALMTWVASADGRWPG